VNNGVKEESQDGAAVEARKFSHNIGFTLNRKKDLY